MLAGGTRPGGADRPRDHLPCRSSSTSRTRVSGAIDAGRRRGADRRDRHVDRGRLRLTGSSLYAAVVTAAQLAASPLLRNQGTVGGNLCQHTRCWYYRGEEWTCWLGGGDTCYAQIGDHRKHNLEPGDCISAHPSDLAPALAACGAGVVLRSADGERELPLLELYRRPTDGQPLARRARAGRARRRRAAAGPAGRVGLPPHGRTAGVLVPARLGRGGAAWRRGLAGRGGVANIPRALDPADPLEGLPGHPQSAWKRTVLATLVERATAAIAGGLGPCRRRRQDAGVVTARMSAMWTSMRAGRTRAPTPARSSIPPIPLQISAATDSARRIRSASGTPSTFASWAALSARPRPPDVGQAHPEQRRRHRDVLVDPGQRQRLRDRVGALRRRQLGQRVAVHDRERRLPEHAADLASRRSARAAPRGARAGAIRQPAVGVVRREEDLLRRHLAHQVEEVDDAPQRGVEEDARHVARSALPGRRGRRCRRAR